MQACRWTLLFTGILYGHFHYSKFTVVHCFRVFRMCKLNRGSVRVQCYCTCVMETWSLHLSHSHVVLQLQMLHQHRDNSLHRSHFLVDISR